VLAEVPADDRKVVLAHASPFFFLDRAPLAKFALEHRMVLMGGTREAVVSGALMSYGPPLTDMFALAASYVDKIAKGAKPSDLPIQQPTKFELVVNTKTAKALGVEIPRAFLARVDEVIE
jgi:putative ABC transport system substrate-binding protein